MVRHDKAEERWLNGGFILQRKKQSFDILWDSLAIFGVPRKHQVDYLLAIDSGDTAIAAKLSQLQERKKRFCNITCAIFLLLLLLLPNHSSTKLPKDMHVPPPFKSIQSLTLPSHEVSFGDDQLFVWP